MTRRAYVMEACRLFKVPIEWISGSGRYALVNPCYCVSVELFSTLAEAKEWLSINLRHCVLRHFPPHDHRIYDLKYPAKEAIYA